MDSVEKQVRRVSLKPLLKRRGRAVSKKLIEAALSELELEALANSLLPDMVAAQKQATIDGLTGRWKNPDYVQSKVNFSHAMYIARKISFQELVFLVSHEVDAFHWEMIRLKKFPELEEISAQMFAIERAHGLREDQYWTIRDAPIEYQKLTKQWNLAEDQRLFEILNQFGAKEVASVFRDEREKFRALQERGRRSFFHKEEKIESLIDVVKRYENEAQVAATAGAYTAAIMLLGAALEGLLLLRCLRSKRKALKIVKGLPKQIRPKQLEIFEKWTLDVLIRTCLEAGWLPPMETPEIRIHPAGLAQRLREIRNYIHPGKISVEKPWVEIEKRDFQDVEAIYVTLLATVDDKSLINRKVKR